jgi:hypothetical protein
MGGKVAGYALVERQGSCRRDPGGISLGVPLLNRINSLLTEFSTGEGRLTSFRKRHRLDSAEAHPPLTLTALIRQLRNCVPE